jgi:hypothetical protein
LEIVLRILQFTESRHSCHRALDIFRKLVGLFWSRPAANHSSSSFSGPSKGPRSSPLLEAKSSGIGAAPDAKTRGKFGRGHAAKLPRRPLRSHGCMPGMRGERRPRENMCRQRGIIWIILEAPSAFTMPRLPVISVLVNKARSTIVTSRAFGRRGEDLQRARAAVMTINS